MTDPVVESKNTIEYSEILKEMDPFVAKVEHLPFRVPIYFFDDEESQPNRISEEELISLSKVFPEVEISKVPLDTYVTCTVMPSYMSILFQTKRYDFFVVFPFLGYALEPYYEEYVGEQSTGKQTLKKGVSENVFKRILCMRDILNGKFDEKLKEV